MNKSQIVKQTTQDTLKALSATDYKIQDPLSGLTVSIDVRNNIVSLDALGFDIPVKIDISDGQAANFKGFFDTYYKQKMSLIIRDLG